MLLYGKQSFFLIGLYNHLALNCRLQGKYEKAMEYYNLLTFNMSEKTFGPSSKETFIAFGNLALMLKNQGKYAEAYELYVKTLKCLDGICGSDHEETLITVHNLGTLCITLKKFDDAKLMLTRAIAHYEKKLGSDHGKTLPAMPR